MASVSSLDKDLRKLRLDKYTPAAANEAKQWIEGILGERLPASDLLEGLKDGVALCKLVSLAVGPPGVKFKKSAMPFVQMENISQFLHACQAPPLNLQQHDMFLTVDLYEQKDPAQVLQCIGAFSRAANAVNPAAFPDSIGPRSSRGAVVSPQSTGLTTPTGLRGRAMSNASNSSSAVYGRAAAALAPSKTGDSGSGRWSPTKSPTQGTSSPPAPVSSWSKREHEGATAPAWNIAQYGYMGGASQGNLGIAFGGRRQITSAGPYVPNMAEKERRRKEQEAEAERQRREEELRRQAEIEAEEERARLEEERRWEEETRRIREEERRRIEEEKRRWAEEERQWKLTEEKRRREEEEAEARLQEERQKARGQKSNGQLRGQYLSQYQAEQESSDKARIRELEKELERARQREAEYQRGRQGRSLRPGNAASDKKARSRSRSRPAQPVTRMDSWSVRDERNFQSTQLPQHQRQPQIAEVVEPPLPPSHSPRPLPDPTGMASPPAKVRAHRTGEAPPPVLPLRTQHTGSRPLPDPTAYSSGGSPETTRPRPQPPASPLQPVPPLKQQPQQQTSPNMSRTDRFLASNPAPAPVQPTTTYARELGGAIDERDAEDRRRAAAQKKTNAGGWASKSLLEREMELERQRQREWEEAQKETAKAVRSADGAVDGIGGGIGGRWDVSQWTGYTGGDSQNRGAQGIGAGRRQIVGPRPLPDPPR
ncbi:Transgelin [Madurella mycetomatis]|uniref:Transgelin n=1 Tax=Madurella mycetomatis TaxID=100816 RepID=A0A175WAJ1_9PEZI|nr:Transgelin [Madurella mycetomatis]